MSADIFISFASKDVKVALTLCSAIESRGFTCWVSARDIQPGDNFQIAIVQALRNAKVLLLVFTANSNTSEEMTKELALASQRKMIVIPLRAEDVAPNDAFAYEFATRQWIDAFADWEFSIEQLCRRLEHALAAPEIEEAPGRAQPEPEPVLAEAPPPAPKVRKAPPAPKVAATAVEDEEEVEETPRRSGFGRLAAAAVFVAVLAGLGIAATTMMRGKPAPAPAPVPLAATQAALVTAPAPAPVDTVPALPDPAEPVAANAVVASAEPVKSAAPRRKAVVAAPAKAASTTEIPY